VLLLKCVGLKASGHRIFGCHLDVGIVERFMPVITFLHSSDCKLLLLHNSGIKI